MTKQPDPHLYVLGEVEVPDGPVKIGMTVVRQSKTGRASMSSGNWRELTVLHRHSVRFADLRWTEWLLHQRLRPWHRRGEWFDVRALVQDDDWRGFIDRVLDGTFPGIRMWRLGDDDHHLVRMRRLNETMPRQFDAHCCCGAVVKGELGRTLQSVQAAFAVEHLGWLAESPEVRRLGRRRWPE
jgi:hypothetical protein